MKYSHLVTVEKKDGEWIVRIDRVFKGGKVDFCSEIELPPYDEANKWDLFDKVACNLGKFICIDSVGIREHLHLNKD